MQSLIVFASLLAAASAGSVLLAPHAVPAVAVGSYKEHHIIPQPDIIHQYARTDVVGVAPIENGVTIKHYSANPAGFGYSHQSSGIHGVKSSNSFVVQPPHAVSKTISVAAPAAVAYAAPAYAAPAIAAAPIAYAAGPAIAYGAPALIH